MDMKIDWKKLIERNKSRPKVFYPGEGGAIGLFVTLVPKFYKNLFLFVVLITFGTIIEY